MYAEEDYLPLSGIQHFVFCRRQWALIHVEELWGENVLTAEGRLLHDKAHDPFAIEKRKDVIITRDLAVHSRELGVSGKCDVVEFFRDDTLGISLLGYSGRWRPRIVEYKRGKSKIDDCDRLQLTAQAMCLEEMLACPKITQSCIFYGETKHREYVELTDALRETVRKMFGEMHEYHSRQHTPRAKVTKSCKRCSLNEQCVPGLSSKHNVAQYIASSLESED